MPKADNGGDVVRRGKEPGAEKRDAGLLRPVSIHPKTESTESEGVKIEGAKTEGAKTEGAKTEGAKTEGAKTEGAKIEGAKIEHSKPHEEMAGIADKVNHHVNAMHHALAAPASQQDQLLQQEIAALNDLAMLISQMLQRLTQRAGEALLAITRG